MIICTAALGNQKPSLGPCDLFWLIKCEQKRWVTFLWIHLVTSMGHCGTLLAPVIVEAWIKMNIVVHSLSHVWLFLISWTAAHQASLSCLCSNPSFFPKLRVEYVLNPEEQKSWEFIGVLHHKAWRQGCSHPCNSVSDPALCAGGTELSRGDEPCERTLQ